MKNVSCLSTCLQVQVPTFRIRSFVAWLSSSSDSGIEKSLTPVGTFPVQFVEFVVQGCGIFSLLRIGLLVSLKNLHAKLFRFSSIVFSRFEPRVFPHNFLGFLVRRLLRESRRISPSFSSQEISSFPSTHWDGRRSHHSYRTQNLDLFTTNTPHRHGSNPQQTSVQRWSR